MIYFLYYVKDVCVGLPVCVTVWVGAVVCVGYVVLTPVCDSNVRIFSSNSFILANKSTLSLPTFIMSNSKCNSVNSLNLSALSTDTKYVLFLPLQRY